MGFSSFLQTKLYFDPKMLLINSTKLVLDSHQWENRIKNLQVEDTTSELKVSNLKKFRRLLVLFRAKKTKTG